MAQAGQTHQAIHDGPKYHVDTSPLHGIGLFASTDISPGVSILNEEPVLNPNKGNHNGLPDIVIYWAFGDLPNNLRNEIMERPHAGHLRVPGTPRKVSFKKGDRPPPYPLQRTWIQLYANYLAEKFPECKRKDYPNDELSGGEFLAIWHNNAFKTRPGEAALFLDAARLNHSCVPNCYAAWNPALGKLTLHAIRGIKKGDELLICYDIDRYLLKPRDERQRGLKECFNFDCTCQACDLSRPYSQEHDTKRVQYANRTPEPNRQKVAANEKIVKETIAFLEEQNTLTWQKAELHTWLGEWYQENGRHKEVVDELRTAYRFALMCFGKDHETTEKAWKSYYDMEAENVLPN